MNDLVAALRNSFGTDFWSVWGAQTSLTTCQADCGTGEQTRTRTRVCLSPRQRPPPGCRYFEIEKETLSCETSIACTGTIGTWGAWTAALCSQYCGQGVQISTRTRVCTAGLCEEKLLETKKTECIGTGGLCRQTCLPPRTFVYAFGNPLNHVCLRGDYLQIACPAQHQGLVSTCDGDYVRCQLYAHIERRCFLPQNSFVSWG